MAFEELLNSSAPFFIALRESLEAALIVGIMAAYLRKVGRTELKKYLILGSGLAILVSIGLGLALTATLGGLSGAASQIFEGTASITAALILSYMIFWMARNSKKISEDLHAKLATAISKGYLFGVAAIAFVAVAREGLETVLLLTAMVGAVGASATLLGTVGGIGLVAGLTFFMTKGMYKFDLKSFFKYTSLILLIFASGLLGYGVHEFIEVAEGSGTNLGILATSAYNINPPDSQNLFHEKGAVGSMLKALIGYDGNPELLRFTVYWVYWLIVGTYLLKTYAPSTYDSTIRRLLHRSVSKTTI